jgi:hypothetical protein
VGGWVWVGGWVCCVCTWVLVWVGGCVCVSAIGSDAGGPFYASGVRSNSSRSSRSHHTTPHQALHRELSEAKGRLREQGRRLEELGAREQAHAHVSLWTLKRLQAPVFLSLIQTISPKCTPTHHQERGRLEARVAALSEECRGLQEEAVRMAQDRKLADAVSVSNAHKTAKVSVCLSLNRLI